MLHIILLILKIIGIILAAILGLLVLLTCIVIFTPFKYKMSGSSDGTLEGIKADAKGSWLFHLVSVYVGYEEQKISFKMRIAWKKWMQSETEPKSERPVSEDTVGDANIHEPITAKEESASIPITIQNKKSQEKQAKEKIKEKGHKNKKKHSLRQLIKKWYQKLLQMQRKIKYTIANIYDKMELLEAKKEKAILFLENPVHKNAFKKTKKELFHLLKRLKPKIIKAFVNFGFEDPYVTGKTLAGLSMVYPFIGNNATIIADFEKAVLNGDILIKGQIRIIYVVITMWNLLWDKNIRTTYKHIKKMK